MVKLTGPILSLEASGTLGKAVTVSNWKGRSYMKKHSIPTNNQQATQLGIRAGMSFLSQAWSALTAGNQATWETTAAQNQISPFDAYIGENLTRLVNAQGLTKELPAAETMWNPTLSGPSLNAFPTFVQVTMGTFPPNAPWGQFLYRSSDDGFTPAPSNLVAIKPGVIFPTLIVLKDQPPTHGTWYYRTAGTNDDGSLFTSATQGSVVF